MTDACALTRLQYNADGSQTRFAFPFEVGEAKDLLVFAGDLPATGYAVEGLARPEGGEVVFASPPAAGTLLTLARRSPLARAGSFRDGGPFRAASLNAELDRLLHLAQETRGERCLAVQAPPYDPALDLALPAAGERAGRVLGFDGSGRPMALALAEIPTGTAIGGHPATAQGATTARSLAEHLAARVNVRDFGAKGDGASDDAPAFHAALAAAQARGAETYVPSSPQPYVLASPIALDGQALAGDGVGSVLKLAHAGPAGIDLAGDGARLARLRILGPGASAWPTSAASVQLAGVAVDGVRVASGAGDALLIEVEVAACRAGLAVEGGVRGIVDARLHHCVTGIEARAGASGSLEVTRGGVDACSAGIRILAASGLQHLALQGGRIGRCGSGVRLEAPAAGWRTAELGDLVLEANTAVDLHVRQRSTAVLRGCRLGSGGRALGAHVDLVAGGPASDAPSLSAEANRAAPTEMRVAALTGDDLNLVAEGDFVVLAGAGDDLDDHWTVLKAARAGLVHRILDQSPTAIEVELAEVAGRPALLEEDLVRVVGRAVTASLDSLGSPAPSAKFTWLRAEDHCRILALHNPMPTSQIALAGSQGELHVVPATGGDRVRLAGVELHRGAVNGARTALKTVELAENAATSFLPPSPIGMALVFGHGALGDPTACVFTYRADGLGYTRLVGGAHAAGVQVAQLTALTGTTGNAGFLTFAAHSDGRIYVENRMSGPARTLSLHLIGAPL